MLEFIFGWGFLSVLAALLIGGGFSVMSTFPPEFTGARWFFSAAYFVLIVDLGWWDIHGQNSHWGATLLLFLLLSTLWIVSLNWVDTRQSAFVSDNERRTKRCEQRKALTQFLERGKQIREMCRSQEPVLITTVHEWEKEIYAYLDNNLGHEYVIRLRTPRPAYLPNVHSEHMSEENHKLYLYLFLRLDRLYEFIKELTDKN